MQQACRDVLKLSFGLALHALQPGATVTDSDRAAYQLSTAACAQHSHVNMATEEQTAVNLEPKLFVGQVPTSTAEPGLRKHFEQFGAIAALSIPSKSANERRRFAMVTMESWAAAERAIEATHGTHALGGDKQALVVRLADPPKGAGISAEAAKGIAPKKLFVGQVCAPRLG